MIRRVILTNPPATLHGVVSDNRYSSTSPSGSSIKFSFVKRISLDMSKSVVVRHNRYGGLAIVVFLVSNMIPRGPDPER